MVANPNVLIPALTRGLIRGTVAVVAMVVASSMVVEAAAELSLPSGARAAAGRLHGHDVRTCQTKKMTVFTELPLIF
jgi:hypothetical protein